MRKVVTGAFLSMDGVMQAPGGPEEDPTRGFAHGGWVVPYADEAFGAAVGKMLERPFDLLLGRKTYDIFAAHWPHAEDGEDAAVAEIFNRITKYVATRSGMELIWANSIALPDAAADVARLKREDGPALLTQRKQRPDPDAARPRPSRRDHGLYLSHRARERKEALWHWRAAGGVQASEQQRDADRCGGGVLRARGAGEDGRLRHGPANIGGSRATRRVAARRLTAALSATLRSRARSLMRRPIPVAARSGSRLPGGSKIAGHGHERAGG